MNPLALKDERFAILFQTYELETSSYENRLEIILPAILQNESYISLEPSLVCLHTLISPATSGKWLWLKPVSLRTWIFRFIIAISRARLYLFHHQRQEECNGLVCWRLVRWTLCRPDLPFGKRAIPVCGQFANPPLLFVSGAILYVSLYGLGQALNATTTTQRVEPPARFASLLHWIFKLLMWDLADRIHLSWVHFFPTIVKCVIWQLNPNSGLRFDRSCLPLQTSSFCIQMWGQAPSKILNCTVFSLPVVELKVLPSLCLAPRGYGSVSGNMLPPDVHALGQL